MNFAWLTELWNASPRSLKKVLASVLVVFAIVFAVVIAVHVWTAGWIQEKLGIVVTKEDLQEQTDTLAANAQSAADQVSAALATYDDSLKVYLQSERRLAVDTTLKPLLKLVFNMNERTKELEALQRTTQSSVSRLPAQYEGALQRIIEEQPPSRTDALLEQLLESQRKQQQQLDTLMKTRARNNKVRM